MAAYIGNPSAHNLSYLTYGPVLLRALGSQNVFTASTVDQMPKQVAAGLMFGHLLSVPVPDLDRCDHLLMLGANPLVSNGSLLTAPNMRGRLRGIRERGGKVVVVDPRRTRTADEADEHHFIRPGGDALLLAAMACTLVEESLVDTGAARGARATGSTRSASWCAHTRPRTWRRPRASPAGEIRRMARELAAAERAAVYARIGTTTQEFGTARELARGRAQRAHRATSTARAARCSPLAAAGPAQLERRPRQRPRRAPGALAEPRSRARRGLRRAARGLPGGGDRHARRGPGPRPDHGGRATRWSRRPNSGRLERAVEGLDFMLALDIYVNETTRHADVILPGAGAAREVRTTTSRSTSWPRAAWPTTRRAVLEHEGPAEWEVLLRLAGVVSGQGPDADVEALDRLVIDTLIGRELADPHSRVAGRDRGRAARGARAAPRAGACARLHAARGAVRRRLRRRTPTASRSTSSSAARTGSTSARTGRGSPRCCAPTSGKIELAPEPIVADLPRLERGDGAAPERRAWS